MKIRHLTFLLFAVLCLFQLKAQAQQSEETLVEFFSDNATMEDNPKQNNYNITIFSPDGQWKMQLNYNSDNMFGTFGNDDFRLSGDGKYYNYARNPKNDMVFYSFTDMKVTVADEGTLYRVHANCLANNNTRFIVEAAIDAPQPEETRPDYLGYARVEPNGFYGTWAIHAENDNYKLSYGVVGDSLLGTFYRADMLMPELYDKKANKQVKVITATAWHTQEGENTNLKIDILGEDHVLYSLTMYNGPYEMEIVGEETIEIGGLILQDLTEMYGCYQFGAENDEYAMAIAVKPEAVTSGQKEWTKDDIIMQYTNLVLLDDGIYVDIFDINAKLEVGEKFSTLRADVTDMDGILYHVTMSSDASIMPQAKDTVNIDFGHVSMIDYTQGLGTVGFGAVKPGQYQMRFYMNAHELEGDFVTEDFNIEMCDMMVVTGDTYLFHDGKYMNANMEKVDGQIRITADMLCIDDVLYHATMYIDPMKCMEGGKYDIDVQEQVDMVSIKAGTEDDYSEYLIQFQNLSQVYDKNDNIVGDGYFFSFYLGHQGPGVSGEYGYSAGTLADDVFHQFYENKCEVRVAPVAGTLSLEAIEPVTIKLDKFTTIKTYLYKVTFQLLGQNGAIYEAEGNNFLICLTEDGDFVNIDEVASSMIQQSLEEKGYKVRKVLKDGKVILDTPDRQYDLQGREMK